MQDGTLVSKAFLMMRLITISSLQTFLEVPTSVQQGEHLLGKWRYWEISCLLRRLGHDEEIIINWKIKIRIWA